MIKPFKKIFRRLQRHLFGKRYIPSIELERFEGLEVAYRSGSFDRLVITTNLIGEHFLEEMQGYQIGENDTIIDVGAHIGAFALSAALRARAGRIHAVEAGKESFNLLRINVALNHIENVCAHHIALSDCRGECTLFYDTDGWGHSTVANFDGRGERTPMITLEDFLNNNKIERCNLMKLNCEGAEFPILLGASTEVLQRFGRLMISVHEDLDPKFTIEGLISHLKSAGFEVTTLKDGQRGQLLAVNRKF